MPTLLVITILLPLVGALVLGFTPRLSQQAARWIALTTVLITLLLSLVLSLNFDSSAAASFQFAFQPEGASGHLGLPWLRVADGPGVRFAVGLDGISLLLVLADLVVDGAFGVRLLGASEGACGAALCADAGASNGTAGLVRQPGHRPVLHLLRVHADPACSS